MPRKINYGADLDDEYDAYEDDDYDYDYDNAYDYDDVQQNVAPVTKAKQEIIKTGIWSCPICTYDNDDTMSKCDICGVLRNPLIKVNSKNDTPPVGGTCKDSGASLTAKSLFASLPKKANGKARLLESHDDAHNSGNTLHDFLKFSRGFSSRNCQKVNIAPFEFNIPSPDDVVSNGLHSLKLNSKDTVSREREMNIRVEPDLDAKIPNSSSLASRDVINGVNDNESASSSGTKPEVSDSTETVSLSSKPEKNKSVNALKAKPISQYKPEKWMIPDKVDDELNQLNLAIVGHVDSGKSTLSGRLLHLLGQVSKKQMHKNEKESKQQGKSSFAYAWALDESLEERERGVTMTVGVAFFNSNRYKVVLLDSPGHRDFVPNMIAGATQADVAILVIDSNIGSFEVGIDTTATGGQTTEHAQLIRSFGVDQIIVAVNKMDVVQYSKERFDAIKQKLGTILRSCGFKDSSVLWVPVSAIENQNLVKKADDERLAWFKGYSLLEAIDSFQLPARDYSKPLILPVCDAPKSQSQGQLSACGKLERGAIRNGSKVLLMPAREIATIRSFERDTEPCSIARAGDNVTVNLNGVEGNMVKSGDVICHPDFPVEVSNHLELKVLVLDVSAPILVGSQLEIHVHHAKESAKVAKILSILDPKTGKVIKKSPRCVLAKQNAVIEVVLSESICVEEYSNCRALGRVSLRTRGRTIALGVVMKIVKEE